MGLDANARGAMSATQAIATAATNAAPLCMAQEQANHALPILSAKPNSVTISLANAILQSQGGYYNGYGCIANY